jgi:hypothetical protein
MKGWRFARGEGADVDIGAPRDAQAFSAFCREAVQTETEMGGKAAGRRFHFGEPAVKATGDVRKESV